MRKILASVLLPAALALAACGGPSETEKYTKAVNGDVQQAGTKLIQSAQRVDASSSLSDYKAAVAEQAATLKALATDLQQVKEPDSISGPHAALVSEINNYAREVGSSATPQDLVDNTKLAVGRIKADIEQINGSL